MRDYFGYGTWEAYGAGRVTIGVSDVHVIGSEGGEETHALNIPEIPSHSHPVFWQASSNGDTSGNSWCIQVETTAHDGWLYNMRSTGSQGGSQPHNNMQPYRTVYRWRRIA